MGSRDGDHRVSTPASTSGDTPCSGYQIRWKQGPAEAPGLIRGDGSVIVPPTVARDVLRALIRDLTARVRADGGEVGPGVRRLLYALHTAAQRAEQDTAARPPFELATEPFDSSATGTAPPPAATVAEVSVTEAADLLGCTPEYVRRLARTGTVTARRIGARTWAIDRAALEDYRHGRTAA
jgi:excisionase family DNA binding protein